MLYFCIARIWRRGFCYAMVRQAHNPARTALHNYDVIRIIQYLILVLSTSFTNNLNSHKGNSRISSTSTHNRRGINGLAAHANRDGIIIVPVVTGNIIVLIPKNIFRQVFGNILLNNFLADSIRNCIDANSFSTIAISSYSNVANVRDPSIISSLDTINHSSINGIIRLQLLKSAKSHITTQSLDNVNLTHSVVQSTVQSSIVLEGHKINIGIFIKVSLDKIANINRDTSSRHLLALFALLFTIHRSARAASQHTDGHHAGQCQSQNLIQFH